MCLKWEMAMMTSRFRATVMKDMEDSRTYISMTAERGCAGFLQEEFRCGTHSSDPSRAAISGEKSLPKPARHKRLSYGTFISCIDSSLKPTVSEPHR